jgi:hypothetical protein
VEVEEAKRESSTRLCAFYRRMRRWATVSMVVGTRGGSNGGGHGLSARRVV